MFTSWLNCYAASLKDRTFIDQHQGLKVLINRRFVSVSSDIVVDQPVCDQIHTASERYKVAFVYQDLKITWRCTYTSCYKHRVSYEPVIIGIYSQMEVKCLRGQFQRMETVGVDQILAEHSFISHTSPFRAMAKAHNLIV